MSTFASGPSAGLHTILKQAGTWSKRSIKPSCVFFIGRSPSAKSAKLGLTVSASAKAMSTCRTIPICGAEGSFMRWKEAGERLHGHYPRILRTLETHCNASSTILGRRGADTPVPVGVASSVWLNFRTRYPNGLISPMLSVPLIILGGSTISLLDMMVAA